MHSALGRSASARRPRSTPSSSTPAAPTSGRRHPPSATSRCVLDPLPGQVFFQGLDGVFRGRCDADRMLFPHALQVRAVKHLQERAKNGRYKICKSMLVELKKLIEANPLFSDKLHFPDLKNSRLRTLINQSRKMQHNGVLGVMT